MNRAALLALFAATAVQAQEIGSEIPQPVTPTSNANAPYDNPYAPNPNTAKPGETAPPAPPATAGATGPQVSAGKGSFGFTAGFGLAGTTTANLPSATFGVAFFVTDLIKLTVDAGMSSTFGSKSPFGFAAAVGIQPTFRSTAHSARPFIVAEVGFGKSFTTVSDDFAMIANLGGGGEYFFSQYFSMNIRAIASLILNLGSKNSDVSLFVITPGIGATVYF